MRKIAKANRNASLSWTFLTVSVSLVILGAAIGMAWYILLVIFSDNDAQGMGVLFLGNMLLGGGALGAAAGMLFNVAGSIFASRALTEPALIKRPAITSLLLNSVMALATAGFGGFYLVTMLTGS